MIRDWLTGVACVWGGGWWGWYVMRGFLAQDTSWLFMTVAATLPTFLITWGIVRVGDAVVARRDRRRLGRHARRKYRQTRALDNDDAADLWASLAGWGDTERDRWPND